MTLFKVSIVIYYYYHAPLPASMVPSLFFCFVINETIFFSITEVLNGICNASKEEDRRRKGTRVIFRFTFMQYIYSVNFKWRVHVCYLGVGDF